MLTRGMIDEIVRELSKVSLGGFPALNSGDTPPFCACTSNEHTEQATLTQDQCILNTRARDEHRWEDIIEIDTKVPSLHEHLANLLLWDEKRLLKDGTHAVSVPTLVPTEKHIKECGIPSPEDKHRCLTSLAINTHLKPNVVVVCVAARASSLQPCARGAAGSCVVLAATHHTTHCALLACLVLGACCSLCVFFAVAIETPNASHRTRCLTQSRLAHAHACALTQTPGPQGNGDPGGIQATGTCTLLPHTRACFWRAWRRARAQFGDCQAQHVGTCMNLWGQHSLPLLLELPSSALSSLPLKLLRTPPVFALGAFSEGRPSERDGTGAATEATRVTTRTKWHNTAHSPCISLTVLVLPSTAAFNMASNVMLVLPCLLLSAPRLTLWMLVELAPETDLCTCAHRTPC